LGGARPAQRLAEPRFPPLRSVSRRRVERRVLRNAQAKVSVHIRPMVAKDTACVAALATQLGYPSTPDEIQRRFERIAGNDLHAVFVAEPETGQAVGWLHVFVCHLVESDPYGEIGGLVVDGQRRGAGFGRQLLEQAATWARAKACASIRLRSNIIRRDAQEFYLKRGYSITKTQHAFAKSL